MGDELSEVLETGALEIAVDVGRAVCEDAVLEDALNVDPLEAEKVTDGGVVVGVPEVVVILEELADGGVLLDAVGEVEEVKPEVDCARAGFAIEATRRTTIPMFMVAMVSMGDI